MMTWIQFKMPLDFTITDKQVEYARQKISAFFQQAEMAMKDAIFFNKFAISDC